jgi:hypothetical protein
LILLMKNNKTAQLRNVHFEHWIHEISQG